jgi:hypothetical protein
MLPLGFIALWLAAELLPLAPTLDIGLVKTNIKPLLQPAVTLKELVPPMIDYTDYSIAAAG